MPRSSNSASVLSKRSPRPHSKSSMAASVVSLGSLIGTIQKTGCITLAIFRTCSTYHEHRGAVRGVNTGCFTGTRLHTAVDHSPLPPEVRLSQ